MKHLSLLVAVCAMQALFANISWTGDVEVPADADETCTDFSAVTSLKINAGATVRFNTATAPNFDITGSGTIVKASADEWTMTQSLSNFKGNYDIAAGVVHVNISSPFGQDSTAYSVFVRNGATLVLESHGKIVYRHIHLAGSGAAGRNGALEMPAVDYTSSDRYYLDLDDDATMYGSGGKYIFIGGALNLNGHRLTITGSWYPTIMTNCSVSPTGEVYLSKTTGSLTLYLRSWTHENPSYKIADGEGPFVLTGGTHLTIWDGVKPINRPLWLSGTNTLGHSSNNGVSHSFATNHANWVGSVIFTNETGLSVLKVSNSVPEAKGWCMLVVSGPISGRGKVETALNNSSNRVALLNPANSYTGGTYINNAAAGRSTLLGYPGTIPNEEYSSVTCNYGYVDLAVGENDSRWTYDAAVRFLGAATFSNSSRLRFSNELTDSDQMSLRFRLEEGTLPGTGYLGTKESVRFVGDGNVTPIPFNWYGGSAVFTGPDPILFGDICLNFDNLSVATNSTVVFDGADATLHITNTFYIGQNGAKRAKVIVKDAVFKNSNVTKTGFGSGYDGLLGGSIFVGYYSPGILEVLDGAVISNRLIVCGYRTDGPWNGGGQGAVFQRGGRVVALGATQNYLSSCVGMCQAASANGYYEMLDGVLEARGRFSIGGYGSGCFAQYGGKVSITNRFNAASKEKNFGMASCNQGYGALYIKKGSWDLCTDDIELGVGATDHPTVDFTLDGDEASFDAHATPIYVGIRSSCATYNFNFNGGVMRCGGIRRISRYYNKTELLTNMVLCVNFNGGTFKAGDNNRNLFGYGATDAALWATNVAVYAGGATIDTDGMTGSRLDTPILGAWGKGVKSIALDAPIKETSYISSPRVIITGDGFGASAFAHFDSTNMVVDRIIVTAPGCGYTSATGTIYYGRNVYKTLTSDAGEIVLDDNANTGSFTKAGEGDLTLYATNTWGGATVLKGGTLKAGCDWAVPTNSAVVLGGGGVLDLNGKAARISSIEYTAGGGSIVNASAAELPASFSLRTTLEDILADRAIVFSGDQDLSGVTLTVEGDDYSALDKNAPRHRVLTVTGGRLVAAPNIVAEPPPAPWAYTVRPDGIILNYVKGSIFIMR